MMLRMPLGVRQPLFAFRLPSLLANSLLECLSKSIGRMSKKEWPASRGLPLDAGDGELLRSQNGAPWFREWHPPNRSPLIDTARREFLEVLNEFSGGQPDPIACRAPVRVL